MTRSGPDPSGSPVGEAGPPGDTEASVVVLCGGTSRRMGGSDKTALPFGTATVLDHLLDSLADWPVFCVGSSRATHREVAWVRESPPGGGPVAGVAAGLALVRTSLVAVVAGDMPFAGPAAALLAGRLAATPPPVPPALAVAREGRRRRCPSPEASGVDAIAARDGDGRAQPLLAAYRCEALRAVLPSDPAGARLMGVLDALRVELVTLADPACLDVDTPEALTHARSRLAAP